MKADPVVREKGVGTARIGAVRKRVHFDAGLSERVFQLVELGQRP